jgi:mRNA interferase HicA
MRVSEFKRRIEAIGCFVKRHGSNHDIYYNPKTGQMFPVPRHGGQEIDGYSKEYGKESRSVKRLAAFTLK